MNLWTDDDSSIAAQPLTAGRRAGNETELGEAVGAGSSAPSSSVLGMLALGANGQAQHRGPIDGVNEDSIGSSRLTIHASQIVENDRRVRLIEISGNYRDEAKGGYGSMLSAYIKNIWSGTYADSNGNEYRLRTRLHRLGGSLDALFREPDITFRFGVCSKEYACANRFTGRMTIVESRADAFVNDLTAIGHEFGHLLGFDHFNNGKGNIMSYDIHGEVKIENIKLLWNRYNLD